MTLAKIKDLQRARHFIDDSMPQYPGGCKLAQYAHTNLSDFNRGFKRLFGLAPFQYFCEQRMMKAKELLGSRMTVGEVALELDYSSSRAFGKAFKRRFGFLASSK